MKQDLVISRLNSARQALSEAKTIQETKKIVDVAAAAEIYAKRQELGEDAVRFATEVKLEALRQLGKMLESTDRRNEARDRKAEFRNGIPVPKTLKELGLSPKVSMLAQQISELPDSEFEKVKTGVSTLMDARKEIRAQEIAKQREALAKSAELVEKSDRFKIHCCDMADWNTSRKFDWIITDPPYPKEFLPLYETLAKCASKWLKDGGLLVAMCGHSYLDEIYTLMSKHLRYYWTGCYLTPGQPTPLQQRAVNTSWKPLLMFCKERYSGKTFGDVFRSDQNEKDFHKWGQSVSGMCDIVSKLVLPGESILDPFCGAGTTGIAALRHGCLFEGIDMDEQNAKISIARLNKEI